jgi:hypothetical protein
MPPKTLILTCILSRSFLITAILLCISIPLFRLAEPLFLYFKAVKLNIIALLIMLLINNLFFIIKKA